jgi:HAE1 family hydrophobic/amphiphilic exporter-1
MYVRIALHEERTLSVTRFLGALFKGKPSLAFEGNYSQRDVMTTIRRRLSKYHDLRVQIRNYTALSLGGAPVDIDFQIRGPELERLNEFANTLREKAENGELKGIVDADTTLKLDKPELRVEIDRMRAADQGVDARDIGTALSIMVGGNDQVTRFHDYQVNEDYDVQLRLLQGRRNDDRAIEMLYLPRKGGGIIPLSNVARLTPALTAGRIDRSDRERMVALRAASRRVTPWATASKRSSRPPQT